MASGKVHAQASIMLSMPTGIITALVANDIPVGICAAIGCGIVGQAISPDLDLLDLTRSEWLVARRLGPFGGLWIAFWWPYGWIYRRNHRHWTSHAPFIGTLVRIAYVCIPFLFIGLLDVSAPTWLLRCALGCIVGLAVSDIGHYVFDFIVT